MNKITIVFLTRAGYRAVDLKKFTSFGTESDAVKEAEKRGQKQVYKRPQINEWLVAK